MLSDFNSAKKCAGYPGTEKAAKRCCCRWLVGCFFDPHRPMRGPHLPGDARQFDPCAFLGSFRSSTPSHRPIANR